MKLFRKLSRLFRKRATKADLKRLHETYEVIGYNPRLDAYEVLEENNWPGLPKSNLTWKEVSDKLIADGPLNPFGSLFIWPVPRKKCPVCKRGLTQYLSDWWDFDEEDIASGGFTATGQHDVQGHYCKNGHYTHLDFA